MSRLARKAAGFVRNRLLKREDGATTIEFVLWMPILAGLIVMIANVTLMLHMQTLLYDAARDTSREVATNNATSAEATARLAQRFPENMNVTATVTIENGFVTTKLQGRYRGMLALGSESLSFMQVNAAVTMWMEQDNETQSKS